MLKAYLDHNATTPVSDEIIRLLPEWAAHWGNPSSIHWSSRQPKNILREARKTFAEALGVSPLEIIFNSGGSESNNTVLRGVFAEQKAKGRNHFMCSAVEHPSVIKTMHDLQNMGARVDFIPVSKEGQIDLDFYFEHLSPETALVSVMYANNETGHIFPVAEMAQQAHEQGALFHSDCVQALGKVKLNLKELDVDFASFSAHKFYALKGTGVLYAKKGSSLPALITGGGQERHRRGGTENTLGIASLYHMAKKLEQIEMHTQKMRELRDYLEARILNEIADVQITGAGSERLVNTSSLVIQGVDGETLLMSLDLKGYAVSTGAACSSGNPEPSPVLLAMGLTRAEAQSSLRISLGWGNSLMQVNEFVETLKATIQRLRTLQDESEVLYVK